MSYTTRAFKRFVVMGLSWFALSSESHAGTILIDDFSADQALLEDYWTTGLTSEINASSIYGGYRRVAGNGYNFFTIIDGHVSSTGDSGGRTAIEVVGGLCVISRTAVSGSASISYGGRAFTAGDRIGDLSLDISGGPSSLADPILLLGYAAAPFGRTVSLSLSSAEGQYSMFSIYLAPDSFESRVDLRTAVPLGIGLSGSVNFENVEDIGLSLPNGTPAGAISFDSIAFIPEPTSVVLALSAAGSLLLRRRRGVIYIKQPTAILSRL